jgi:hypothetical protein
MSCFISGLGLESSGITIHDSTDRKKFICEFEVTRNRDLLIFFMLYLTSSPNLFEQIYSLSYLKQSGSGRPARKEF